MQDDAIGSSVDGTDREARRCSSSFVNGSHSPSTARPRAARAGEGPATPSSSSRPPLSPLAPAPAPVSGRRLFSASPRRRVPVRLARGRLFRPGLLRRRVFSPRSLRGSRRPRGWPSRGWGRSPFAFGSGSGSRGGGGGRRGREAASLASPAHALAARAASGAESAESGGLAALAFPRLDGPERESGRDDTLARGSNAIELGARSLPPRVVVVAAVVSLGSRFFPGVPGNRHPRPRRPFAYGTSPRCAALGSSPLRACVPGDAAGHRGAPALSLGTPRAPPSPGDGACRPAEAGGGVRGGVGGRRVAFRAGRRGGRFRRPRRRRRCRRDVPRNVRVRPGRRGGGARARAAAAPPLGLEPEERRSASSAASATRPWRAPSAAWRPCAGKRPWPVATGAARLRARLLRPAPPPTRKSGKRRRGFRSRGPRPRPRRERRTAKKKKKQSRGFARRRSEKPQDGGVDRDRRRGG